MMAAPVESSFFRELMRRKVITVGTAYVVVAWLLLQVASTLFPIFGAPGWVLKAFTVVLFLGLPVALVLAWAYEVTPQGVTRAAVGSNDAVATAAYESAAAPDRDRALSMPSGPSIAVLPFRNLSGEPDQDLFARAMTGDIVTGLTQSSSLFVVATGDTFAGEQADAETMVAGRELGVRYVLRGAVNRSGRHLRVTAQLADTSNGLQTWSGKYDRELSADSLFEVQDDIREKIVATLGDLHGVIYSAETKRNASRPTDSLDAYECLSVALAYDKHLSEERHLRARESLERAVRLDPQFDSAWAHLSWIYTDEKVFGYNPLPEPMKRARAAARRAIELAPENYHDHWLLSRVHYFAGERDLFLAEVEKSLALNSSDGTTLGLIGGYLALAGEWERGVAFIEKATLLNPRHPDYYFWFLGVAALGRGDAEAALAELRKMSASRWPMALIFLSAISVITGRTEEADRYATQLLEVRPGFTLDEARASVGMMLPYQPEMVDRVISALGSTAALQA